jgi:hypothetical protein
MYSSTTNQLAFSKSRSVHHPGSRTDDDDLHNSIKNSLLFGESVALYPGSRRGFLAQHSWRSSDRMTPMQSDACLATLRVESSNTV